MAGIKDVAAAAGVSISTVSYALNGKRPISVETRQRVLRAARELGYMPNLQARGLRGQQTHVLALSSPVHEYTDTSNYAVYFFALAMRARYYGYDILLLMDEYGDQEIARVSHSGMVDGILLLDVLLDDARAEVAQSLDIPVVSVGFPSNTESVYCVDLDFERMGRESIERAASLGHRHIAIIGNVAQGYDAGSNYLVRYVTAARKRAEDIGVQLTFVPATGYGRADVDLTLNELTHSDPQISMIICQSNAAHITHVVNALGDRGLRIPHDISVMAACTYGLQSMAFAVDEMPMRPDVTCSRAVDMMVEILQGKRCDVGKVELLSGTYIAHGSVASPGSSSIGTFR